MTNGGQGGALCKEVAHAFAEAYQWPGDDFLVQSNPYGVSR